ncbi:MAG: hypothetical protein LBP53_03440 [Candidatus Peribacteria bacterium]|nr:hypothetical protein [Candidatus Peribacteria bacterium]
MVLGGIAYFAVVIGRIIIQPTVGFTMWMQDEIKHNPTMETVFKQP